MIKEKTRRRIISAIVQHKKRRTYRIVADCGAIFDEADILRRLDRCGTIKGERL